MASIKLENIRKVYKTDSKEDNGVAAVKDFNMEISDQEFIVLVGPSGCGKSTVLRMIAGLEDITSGQLYIDEVLANDLESKDRNIAMVFQTYALYPHMTVYENLSFPLEMEKINKNKRKELISDVAKKLEIEEFLDRKPKALSGGQRQRVAIGRAIVRNPKVLLMDEPLSNLDAKLRGQMRSEIIKLRNQIDATFVYVTHDQTEAMTLGDRIVVMNNGYIQQIGTPSEIYDNPKNLFVATFIGAPQINMFETSVDINESEVKIFIDNQELIIDKNIIRSDLMTSDKYILGVRPENCSISKSHDEFGVLSEYQYTEILGGEMHIHSKYQDSEIVVVESKNEFEKNGHSNLEMSDKLKIKFEPNDILLFNNDTQESVMK